MTSPKIAVLGTGANGAGIGANLVQAGLDVTFIEQWPENVEALREHGVRVEIPGFPPTATPVRAINLCEVATLHDRFDVVFVLVKAYDTRWACELVKPYLAPDAVVIGLQNGMTVDAMADIVGVDRTLGSVIECSAAMYRAGVVERHTPPSGSWFALGGLSPAAHEQAASVAELLGHAGTVEVVDDIRSAKWMKLVVNTAELVPSAILDLPLLEAAELPGVREFMLRAGREAIRTAVALGHRPVPIFGLNDVDASDPDGFADALFDAVCTRFMLPHSRTTVLQDWMKGRHSEVDEINGLVVSSQAALGGTCPANARTVELAHRIERGELTASPDNARLLLEAAAL